MADGEFEDHEWYASGEEGNEERYKKRPTSTFIADERESPYISKTDGGSDCGHDEGKAGIPVFLFRYDISPNNN